MTAYDEGYQAYYNDEDNCPYDYDTQNDEWNEWYTGHMEAYCIGEGK